MQSLPHLEYDSVRLQLANLLTRLIKVCQRVFGNPNAESGARDQSTLNVLLMRLR